MAALPTNHHTHVSPPTNRWKPLRRPIALFVRVAPTKTLGCGLISHSVGRVGARPRAGINASPHVRLHGRVGLPLLGHLAALVTKGSHSAGTAASGPGFHISWQPAAARRTPRPPPPPNRRKPFRHPNIFIAFVAPLKALGCNPISQCIGRAGPRPPTTVLRPPVTPRVGRTASTRTSRGTR